MEVRLFLCTESAIVDNPSNRLSIFNLIDELSAASFPAGIALLSVVAIVARKKSETEKMTFEIKADHNNRELFKIPIVPNFEGKLKSRIIANFQGIVVTEAGALLVSLLYKKRTVATWLIDVIDVRNSPLISKLPIPISTTARPASQRRKRKKK